MNIRKIVLEYKYTRWKLFNYFLYACGQCYSMSKLVILHSLSNGHFYFWKIKRGHLIYFATIRAPVCFTFHKVWLFHRTGTGWYEFRTEGKPCKRVRARGGDAWAWMAHGLQCLQDGRACCPVVLKQLVICRFLRCSAAPVTLLFQVVVSLYWYGLVWISH